MTRAANALAMALLALASCGDTDAASRVRAVEERAPSGDDDLDASPADAAGAPSEPRHQQHTSTQRAEHTSAARTSTEHTSESCGRCHVEIAEEWARSRHHGSFDDPIFGAEWGSTRDPWCVGCHAPLARDADDVRVHEGVGCASCHVVDGVVVTAEPSGRARHETRADPSLATEALCARCHQFGFPHAPEIPMQDTVREWRASGSTRTCVDCHARTADGAFSHEFAGMRDPSLASRAIAVDASAVPGVRSTRVTIRLRSRAGHAVPTGDLFRRLVVSAWIENVPRSRRSAVLSRELAVVPGEGRLPVADHRVPPRGVREVVLELPRVEGEMRIRHRIDLEALDPRAATRRGLRGTDVRQRVGGGLVPLRAPER